MRKCIKAFRSALRILTGREAILGPVWSYDSGQPRDNGPPMSNSGTMPGNWRPPTTYRTRLGLRRSPHSRLVFSCIFDASGRRYQGLVRYRNSDENANLLARSADLVRPRAGFGKNGHSCRFFPELL